MDQRAQPRFPCYRPVVVSVLHGPARRTFEAILQNVSGRGMRLIVPEPVILNSAVKVDLQLDGDDALILGEVVYCAPQGGSYAIGLDLRHSLTHLTDLGTLMHRLLGDVIPEPLNH